MNGSTDTTWLEQITGELIGAEPDLFLVEIRIKPTHNIKVFIDGDQGVSIERLVQLNRKLYKRIEEAQVYPEGEFSLEVSSPGLDEPLKLHRQYVKNSGRFVELTLKDERKLEGKLAGVTADHLIIEETKGKGKKTETIVHNISFDNIKTTKVQIKF